MIIKKKKKLDAPRIKMLGQHACYIKKEKAYECLVF
jgi:hypothetical protein